MKTHRQAHVFVFITLCLLVTVLFAGSGFASRAAPNAVTFSPNRPVTNATYGYEGVADLEIGPGNVLYAVFENRREGSIDIYFAKSTDGGVTWTGHTRVHSANLADQVDAELEIGADGTLYVAWVDHRYGPTTFDVYLVKSADGGLTWSAEQRLNDVRGSVISTPRPHYPVMDMAVYSNTVYLLWSAEYAANAYVYFDYSADGGLTWHADKTMRDTMTDYTYGVSLAVDDNGVIYATWMDDRGGFPEDLLYFSRSENGGSTWTTNRLVSTNIGNDNAWPDILAWGNGQLCVIWSDFGATDFAMSSRSTDKGQTFSTRLRVSAGAAGNNEEQVDLARDPASGAIYAVWDDNRGSGGDDVYLSVSTNGCQSWTEKGRVNLVEGAAIGGGGWPNIEVSSTGVLQVIWTADDYRLRASQSADGGTAWDEFLASNQIIPSDTQSAPAIAAEADGSQAYALFLSSFTGGTRVDLTTSADQWQTRSANIAVSSGAAANLETPRLARGAIGQLYAAWGGFSGNYDVYFAPSINAGLTWAAPIKLNTDTGTTSQRNPALAADGASVCAAWEDQRGGTATKIYARCSAAGGSSWSTDRNVITPTNNTGAQTLPTIAVSGAQVYVAWRDARTTPTHIRFNYSPDLGQTWTLTNTQVETSTGATTNPSIAVDGSGKVCVAWEDGRTVNDSDIYVACSVNHGATWGSGVNVMQETGAFNQSTPVLRYAPIGQWHLAWKDNRTTYGSDIYHATSPDAAQWTDNLRVIDEQGSIAQTAPALAVDTAGRAYMAWTDPRQGRSSVYASVSSPYAPPPPLNGTPTPTPYPSSAPDPTGSLFGPSRRVSDNGAFAQNDPDIVAGPGGVLYAVWEDQRAGAFDVYFAKSTDNGTTWSAPVCVNDYVPDQQFEPHIAVDPAGKLYVAWQDDRNNPGSVSAIDVFFAWSANGGSTWSNSVNINDQAKSVRGGDRFNDRPAIDITSAQTDTVYITWIDTRLERDAFLAYSLNGGIDWAQDINLRDTSESYAQYPTVAVDGNGKIYVAWEDHRDSGGIYVNPAVYFTSLTLTVPAANTYIERVNITSGSPGQYRPDLLAWGTGNLCVVYEHVGTGLVHSKRSTNAGASWVNDVILDSGGTAQGAPRLSRNASGSEIYAVWDDSRGSGGNVYAAKSTNGCQTWTAQGMINVDGESASDPYPSVAYGSASDVFVSWINDVNTDKVYVSRKPTASVTWTHTAVNLPAFNQIQTQPALVVSPDGGWAGAAFQCANPNGDGNLCFTYSTDSIDNWVIRHPDVYMTDNDGVGDPRNVDLALGMPNSLYAVWEDTRFGIAYATSTDGGLSWSANRRVNLESPGTHQNPALALANWDDLCVAWETNTAGNYDIYARCSSDSGYTWNFAHKIISDATNSAQTTPDVVVFGQQVYAVWKDMRGGAAHIYFARSDDFGSTWGANVQVDHSTGAAANPTLSRAPDGQLCVAWDDLRAPADKDVYVSCSGDNGATWSADANAIQEANAVEQRNPVLAYSGYWRLAWADNRATWDAYYAESGDGQTWGANTRMNDTVSITPTQDIPALAVDNRGTAYAAWQDNRTGYNNIYFAKTLQARLQLSTALAVSPLQANLGSIVFASFGVQNQGDVSAALSLTVRALHASGRPYTFPITTNITLAPGQIDNYSQSRVFDVSGPYTASAGYLDSAGNFQSLAPNTTVVFTVTMGSPALSSPPNGALICGNQPALRWLAVPGVTGYNVLIGSNPVLTTTATIISPTLSDGTYLWQARGYDALNAPGSWSPSFSLTVDTTPPAAPSPTTPSNGAFLTTTTPTLQWASAAQSGFEIELDGVVSATATTTYTPATPLALGVHTWRVRALDQCHYLSTWSAPYTFTVAPNLAAPVVLQPANNGYACTAAATISWSAVSNADQYWLSLDGNPPVILNSTDYTTSTLFEGRHSLSLRAASHWGSASLWATSNFTQDLTAPTMPTPLYPLTGAIITDTTPVIDAADSLDSFSPITYTFRLNATSYTTITSAYPVTYPLGAGTHTWFVTASDACVHTSASSPAQTFVVSTTVLPPPILQQPTSGQNVCNSSINFAWNAGAADGVRFRLDTGPSIAITTSSYLTRNVSEGAHTWALQAFAVGGHESDWVTGTFTVDLTPPSIPALLQPAANVSFYITPTFDWADSSGDPVSYTFYLNNSPTATFSSAYTPTTLLAPGVYTWTVRAHDACAYSSSLAPTRAFTFNAPAPWVMLFYFSGDNNQITATRAALNQLEAVANNPAVVILALWDQNSAGDTRVYQVQYDADLNVFTSPPLTVDWNPGELNMGDPQTLESFINWGKTNYPAEHYFLSVFDHGGGWSPNLPIELMDNTRWGLGGTGLAWDMTDQDYLSTPEMSLVLSRTTQNGANPIDLLYYDASLMAMLETAYDVQHYARYLVASENALINVFPYTGYIPAISTTTQPRHLAENMVMAYAATLNNTQGGTIAAFDLSKAESLAVAVNRLAQAILATDVLSSQVRSEIFAVYSATQKFDYDEQGGIENSDGYVDLKDFVTPLSSSSFFGPAVHSAAIDVSDLLEVGGFIAQEAHLSGSLYNVDQAQGVSIYMPLGEELYVGAGCAPTPAPGLNCIRMRDYYSGAAQLAFVADTLWDEMLNGILAAQYPSANISTSTSRPPENFPPVRPNQILSAPRRGNLDGVQSRHLYLPSILHMGLPNAPKHAAGLNR